MPHEVASRSDPVDPKDQVGSTGSTARAEPAAKMGRRASRAASQTRAPVGPGPKAAGAPPEPPATSLAMNRQVMRRYARPESEVPCRHPDHGAGESAPAPAGPFADARPSGGQVGGEEGDAAVRSETGEALPHPSRPAESGGRGGEGPEARSDDPPPGPTAAPTGGSGRGTGEGGGPAPEGGGSAPPWPASATGQDAPGAPRSFGPSTRGRNVPVHLFTIPLELERAGRISRCLTVVAQQTSLSASPP